MDKRKANGGHSTKAKGLDKRKNEYKNALELAADVEDVTEVISIVMRQAKDGDMQACKLFLEYYLGKPKQQIEQNNTHAFTEGFDIKKLYDKETQE